MENQKFEIATIGLTEVEGEPRARDLDLAERLGFDRPRKIRDLIKANMAEIEGFGTCPAVGRVVKGGRGSTVAEEFYLNEEQALLVAILSKTPNAPAVRAMLIKVFVAWRRASLESSASLSQEDAARELGMVKSLVRDLAILRRDVSTEYAQITAARDEIRALHEENMAAARRANGAISMVGFKLALQVAVDHGIPQKGRGRLVPRMARSLLKFCRSRGWPLMEEFREDGVRRRHLFSVEAISAWLLAEGHAMITAHLAGLPFVRVPDGQCVLKLVPSSGASV